MLDIRISEQVRAVLGADGTAQALAIPLDAARCAVCQDPIGAAGPAAVVVTLRGSVKHVRYAHPRCAPSAVFSGDPLDVPDDGLNMDMTAGLILHGTTHLPVLLAELSSPTFTQHPDGAITNMLVAGMLERGFTLVTGFHAAPPTVAGWTVTIADQLQVTDADGTPFYAGDIDLPPGWLDLANLYSGCVLYTGGIVVDDAGDPDAVVAVLRAAARAGQLVGAGITLNR